MKRTANANWQGTGLEGKGELTTQSGTFKNQPYSFKTRFQNDDGKLGTNPEELIAAAHAGCFNMALSFQLGGAGYPPTELNTEAVVAMEKVDGHFKIMGITLNLEAKVEGIEENKLLEIAQNAKKSCPISQALEAVEITLNVKSLSN